MRFERSQGPAAGGVLEVQFRRYGICMDLIEALST
jgi:hypothetical protein